MQPEKKQLEILLMHYFRLLNPDFPKGKLTPSESPDFILKLKSRHHIGIELTRLSPVNMHLPDVSELEQKVIRERIIESAKLLVEQTFEGKLFVKVLFSESAPVEEMREILVTAHLANAVRKVARQVKPARFFYKIIDNKDLPRGLENILVVHHPAMEVSIWERSNNLGISEDVLADIRLAIYKKDEKLRLYQRQGLNFYWLIIVADKLRGIKNYNLHEKIMNHVFQSHFQQVFLFDLLKAKILQLV